MQIISFINVEIVVQNLVRNAKRFDIKEEIISSIILRNLSIILEQIELIFYISTYKFSSLIEVLRFRYNKSKPIPSS